MIWLLVGYMWLFVHRPFEVWHWMGDMHLERVYMIATIAYWAFCAPKSWTSNRIHWGIGLLAAAIVLATLFSPYTSFESPGVQDWFKILVFYILVVSSVRTERELRILVVSFVVITGLYELHSFREYLCGRGVFAMGTWRMVGVDSSLGDPNGFAASVNYGVAMLLPVWTLARKRWHYWAIRGLLLLACLCVFLTGSRTGFAGLGLLLLGGALTTKHRMKILLLLVVACPLAWQMLPSDLQDRYLTLVDPASAPANARTSSESRSRFFWMAVDIWEEHPVFGVGPACFSIASRTGMQAHTLYGQTIAELGTAGALALLAIVGGYVGNYRDGRRLYRILGAPHDAKFCYYVLLATAIALAQLLFLGFGGHNLFRYTWLWYGAFAALALRFLREYSYGESYVYVELDDPSESSGLELLGTIAS
jgi:hypothetical protein